MHDRIGEYRPNAGWTINDQNVGAIGARQFGSTGCQRVPFEARYTAEGLNGLTAHTLAIQEEERRRIASELHDGLGQMLSVLLIELRNARHVVEGCGVKARIASASLDRASEGARTVIEELRRSVMALYPSMLDDLGLAASLSWMLRDLCKAQPRLHVDCHLLLTDKEVPEKLHITIFRIVQEAVNNVLKHAHAKTLAVVLDGAANAVVLTIRDDGCGIEKPTGKPVHAGGLAGMMRRASLSGGAFEIATGPGSGTCITVTWQ